MDGLLVSIELMGELLCFLSVKTLRKELVDFMDEVLVGGHMVKKTLRDEDATVVLSLISSLGNDIADTADDIN